MRFTVDEYAKTFKMSKEMIQILSRGALPTLSSLEVHWMKKNVKNLPNRANPQQQHQLLKKQLSA